MKSYFLTFTYQIGSPPQPQGEREEEWYQSVLISVIWQDYILNLYYIHCQNMSGRLYENTGKTSKYVVGYLFPLQFKTTFSSFCFLSLSLLPSLSFSSFLAANRGGYFYFLFLYFIFNFTFIRYAFIYSNYI